MILSVRVITMKKFFAIFLRIFKPLNKWHAAVYIFIFCISFYAKMTLPPAEVISDYQRIEGELIEVDYPRGRVGDYSVDVYFNDEKYIFIFNSRRDYNLYRSWLNKKVVVYYYPEILLNRDNQLIFMSPLSEEEESVKVFMEQGGFNRPKVKNETSQTIFFLVLLCWMIPFLMKEMLKIRKARENENDFIPSNYKRRKNEHS